MPDEGNSAASGGGIYNAAEATAIVSNSVFTGNLATGNIKFGGGVYNDGDLTVDTCIFGGSSFASGNSALAGGGIYNAADGTAQVSDSTFLGNRARKTVAGSTTKAV